MTYHTMSHIKDATVKRFYYEGHDQLRSHLADFARRHKTPSTTLAESWWRRFYGSGDNGLGAAARAR